MRFSAWVTTASSFILAAALPAGAAQGDLVSRNDDGPRSIVSDKDTAAPASARRLYVLVPGDTLYGIARRFGVSVNRLAEMNGLQTPGLVHAGMILMIPDSARPGGVPHKSAPSPGKPASYRDYTSYTVRPGDTLYHLARSHHVTVAALAEANSIVSPDSIRVGQILRIPGPSASPHEMAAVEPRPGRPTNSTGPAGEHRGSSAFPSARARDLSVRRVTTAAREFVGAPYTWGGTSRSGIDCSGLVYILYSPYVADLPRTSFGQFTVGIHVAREGLAPGDLVFFNSDGSGASHVGIYVGDGQFVTASASAGRTVLARLDNPYWTSHYIGARRLF